MTPSTDDQHWRPQGAELTCRERQILALIALGYSNVEIGVILYIGAETVKSHVRHILLKLRARSRAEAVYRAMEDGWLVTRSQAETSGRSRTSTRPCANEWSGVPDDLLKILTRDSPS